MRASIVALFGVIAVMGFVLAAAVRFPYLQAKLAPVSLSGIVLILAAVQLIREVRSNSKGSAEVQSEKERAELAATRRRYLIEGGWVVGFLAAIYVFGLLVALPGFGIAYTRAHGVKWPLSLTVAAIMTLLSYGTFSVLLGVRLYPGLLSRLLGW
jgi:hypothetical protein